MFRSKLGNFLFGIWSRLSVGLLSLVSIASLSERNKFSSAAHLSWAQEDEKFLFVETLKYGPLRRMVGYPHKNFDFTFDREMKLYGHGAAIQSYIGDDTKIPRWLTAEHGNILADQIAPSSAKFYTNKTVLVFSKRRATFLERRGIRAFPIGPYIHYSNIPIGMDEFLTRKQKLGRVVLHFPLFLSLSAKGAPLFERHNLDHYIAAETLKKLRDDGLVDTVVVCYRWADITRGDAASSCYEKIPSLRACCGSPLSPFFQSHLRLLFELADVTTSNIVSTQLGSSIFLGKPHFVIGASSPENFGYKQHDASSLHLHNKFYLDMSDVDIGRFFQKSTSFVSDLWGFDCVLSRESFRSCLRDGFGRSSG